MIPDVDFGAGPHNLFGPITCKQADTHMSWQKLNACAVLSSKQVASGEHRKLSHEDLSAIPVLRVTAALLEDFSWKSRFYTLL